MQALKLALRKLFRKGEHSVARILSLAAGLAFGLILLSEVFYYQSFDSFYPDAHRIYLVQTEAKLDKSSDELSTFPQVSGAIAPGMKAEVPGIEAATRLTSIGTSTFYDEQQQRYKGRVVFADASLPDVLPRPMMGGIAKELLASPMKCMISSELAETMGGNVIGKSIQLRKYPDKPIAIAGVYEKIPENSNYSFDIAISMASIGQFMWDGSENWLGNDRYFALVKLEKGISPKSLAPAIRKMQEKHQDIEKLEKENNFELHYTLEPLQRFFPNKVKNMSFILSAVAFIVLFVSIMNYMLLTISTLVKRAKSSAIFKCYGADKWKLQGMIFIESGLIFVLSLLLAFLLILLGRPLVEAQVGHKLSSTLNAYVLLPLLGTLVAVVFLVTYFPGRVFAQTPVAAAFRNYRYKNTQWKKGLLAVQFTGATLFLAMLFVVSLQYSKMKNTDHGYDAEDVYFSSVTGMDPHKLNGLLSDLRAMPEIMYAGYGFNVPIYGASGNNVLSPDKTKELFNVADYYYVDENYCKILNFPFNAGKGFEKGTSKFNDIIISQKAADLLVLNNGWKDGVVGKDITITEHGTGTICGIFDDFIIGTIADTDIRPSAFLYSPEESFPKRLEEQPNFSFMILVKSTPGAHPKLMEKLTALFQGAMIRDDVNVKNLAQEQEKQYQPQRGFRNTIYTGSLIILLVTILGLIGYLNDEIVRYRKSLAIRKINGATIFDIVKIFVLNIAKLAVPCIVIGLTGAYFLGIKWEQNFSVKEPLHWWVFGVAGAGVLLLSVVVAVLNSLQTARRNPVESLRYE